MDKIQKWECFCDEGYYHQWAVRPIGDKSFQSQLLFHVPSMEEAEALRDLLNSKEAASKGQINPEFILDIDSHIKFIDKLTAENTELKKGQIKWRKYPDEVPIDGQSVLTVKNNQFWFVSNLNEIDDVSIVDYWIYESDLLSTLPTNGEKEW